MTDRMNDKQTNLIA